MNASEGPRGRPGGRVLVTGAGGFGGGHVARMMAHEGYEVRGFARRDPDTEPDDPVIEWFLGDLRDADARRRAVAGCSAVIHTAAWVSLGRDRQGEGRSGDLGATPGLARAAAAGG